MKNIIAAAIVALSLSACVVVPGTYAEVSYEPDVVVGAYYVGYYNPGYGYWTGNSWDINFYGRGHGGYGHYYRGAPHSARGYYHGGHGGNGHRYHH